MTLKVIQGHPHQVGLIKTMVQINEIANEFSASGFRKSLSL